MKTFEEIVAATIECVKAKKAGADIQKHAGFEAVKMMQSLHGFAESLNAIECEKEREILLIALWPVICEAAREKGESRLSKAVREMMAI